MSSLAHTADTGGVSRECETSGVSPAVKARGTLSDRWDTGVAAGPGTLLRAVEILLEKRAPSLAQPRQGTAFTNTVLSQLQHLFAFFSRRGVSGCRVQT